MTSPELDKAEAVADSLGKQMMKDHARRVRALADGKAKDDTITRLSSELAASRDREMALEREFRCPIGLDDTSEICSAGSCRTCIVRRATEYARRAEAAEAEVKRLRAETIEECLARLKPLKASRARCDDYIEGYTNAIIHADERIRALATTGLQGGGDG